MGKKAIGLSQEQIHGILDAAVCDPEDYLFLHLLAYTGRRIGEILEIRVNDINFARNYINTIIQKTRDDKSRSKIPIRDETTVLLQQYIYDNNLFDDDKLFTKSRRTYQRRPTYYAIKSGLFTEDDNDRGETPSCHSFRRAFITYFRRQGWTREDISLLTGHKTTLAVAAYDELVVDDVADKFREGLANL